MSILIYTSIVLILILVYISYRKKVAFYERFETADTSNIMHFYSDFHLGDNIFFGNYLTNIADELRAKGMHINYYVVPDNIEKVKDFFPSDVCTLHPLDKRPESAHNDWLGTSIGQTHIFTPRDIDFVEFLKDHYNIAIGVKYNLPTMQNFLHSNKKILDRYDSLDPACKNIDILILNSIPQSGQYNYNKEEWDKFCKYLSNKYNVITSEKVEGVKCTRDYNLSLYDIGALSTHVKYIVGVNSGPFAGCLNTYTFNNVKHMYIFDMYTKYKGQNITNVTDINEVMKVL